MLVLSRKSLGEKWAWDFGKTLNPMKKPAAGLRNYHKQETTKYYIKRHYLFKTTYLLWSNLIKTQVNLEFTVNCLSSTML